MYIVICIPTSWSLWMCAVCSCVFLEWSSEVYAGVAVAPSQGAFTDLRSTMRLKNEIVGSFYSLWKLGLEDLTKRRASNVSVFCVYIYFSEMLMCVRQVTTKWWICAIKRSKKRQKVVIVTWTMWHNTNYHFHIFRVPPLTFRFPPPKPCSYTLMRWSNLLLVQKHQEICS